MICDCFIFNDELDLLELRLSFLDDIADRYVLVESERTLSGKTKPLHYHLNKHRFKKFEHKIIHVIAPANELAAWEYESFQRNAIKNGLTGCAGNDIIFISDVDEIINIKDVLQVWKPGEAALIELPMYYYFFNLKSNKRFFVNLVAEKSYLENKDIGHRYSIYPELTSKRITMSQVNTGWHFSYLFGYNVEKYQQKIGAFSHEEFNTSFYLSAERIRRCIRFRIDLFERHTMRLSIDQKNLDPILPYIRELPLSHLFYQKEPTGITIRDMIFILHSKYYRRVKGYLQNIFKPKP